MKEIRSVGIIGAGALGLLYIEQMESRLKDKAYFLASEKRNQSINSTIYSLNGTNRQFRSCNPLIQTAGDMEIRPDLIILAVKNYHLKEVLPLLRASAGPETILMSVLNGISSESFLKQSCPDSTVLYAAALGMDAVKEGNTLNYSNRGKIIIGSESNTETEALKLCCNFFEYCGIDHLIPEDIHRELWYKWMINIGVNQVSAVTGASYGRFQTDPLLQDLMNEAMLETIPVAQSEKINLSKSELKSWYSILTTLGAEGKTSMLQDMEAHRQTEVDSFGGELIRRAEQQGIAVPVNRTLYAIIKTREDLFKEE